MAVMSTSSLPLWLKLNLSVSIRVLQVGLGNMKYYLLPLQYLNKIFLSDKGPISVMTVGYEIFNVEYQAKIFFVCFNVKYELDMLIKGLNLSYTYCLS